MKFIPITACNVFCVYVHESRCGVDLCVYMLCYIMAIIDEERQCICDQKNLTRLDNLIFDSCQF